MSNGAADVATRPVYLTREGSRFRLSFRYDPELVERARQLPFAKFDQDSKSWTCQVCTQAVGELRKWWWDGLVDANVDDLISPGETLETAPDAVLRPGTLRRPYVVVTASRDDEVYSRLRTIPGGSWDKGAGAMTFPPHASAALLELVERGVIEDPDKILRPAAVVLSFDSRTGGFKVLGDPRAQAAFTKYFPGLDVYQQWRDKGLDVGFADPFSEEVYRGELVRAREGFAQIEGIDAELWPYQAQSVAVALERAGLGVFHEMGLGKTLVAIAAGHEIVTNRKEAPRTVVVVPGAVRTQWAREITRFTGCTDVVVIDGDKKKRHAGYAAAKGARWMIVHYDVLHLDAALIGPLCAGSVLVADEAHRLKNPTAKRTKAMRTLAQKAHKRIALSGTPVENDPGEFYSLMNGFVAPGVFGSPTDFLSRYSYPNRWGGYEGARNLGELRERCAPHYIRYTKSQVAQFLPPLRVQHKPLDVDPAYASALRRAHREARDEIKRAALERAGKTPAGSSVLNGEMLEEVETGAEMTAVGMLRLLCSSPRLILASDAPAARALVEGGLVPEYDGPKLDELRLLLAELQSVGARVVVFSSSKRMVELVCQRLEEDAIRHVKYTGDTSTADRDAAVNAFCAQPTEENPGPTAFVATDAGGEGLNLGKHCSLLVNLDIPWTPGRLAQRSARIHRLDGTAEQYLVINFTLKGTIEEGILRMVEQKADLADAIFGEGGGRRRTTGRGGRSVFEEVIDAWFEENAGN